MLLVVSGEMPLIYLRPIPCCLVTHNVLRLNYRIKNIDITVDAGIRDIE